MQFISKDAETQGHWLVQGHQEYKQQREAQTQAVWDQIQCLPHETIAVSHLHLGLILLLLLLVKLYALYV